MNSILLFLGQERVAFGLYIIIVVGIVYYLLQFLSQRAEYRSTYFELERDLARYRQLNAVTIIIVLIQVGLIVLGIQLRVVPVLSQEMELANVQPVESDGIFNTPTPQPLIDDLGIEPEADLGEEEIVGVLVTPTLTPTPVGTIIPSDESVGCDSDQAYLQIPANGMRVFQAVPVRGTAFTDDFAYAKIELRGAGTFDNFVVIEDIRSPVRTLSEFSQFIPTPYEEGWYEFRLMVFDITDTLRASCMVNIYVSPGFSTPTPSAIEG